ncbi:MAG: hypothetical protein B1H04_02850 [Planctomycetales bacterium 4484_123]|nr:MAG: hypothetical protein B1H04_02850 [Planctomycetales bacterium 4484_123]
MTRLLAIARNAFVETIRQPIFGVLILLTFTMLVLDVPLSAWTMGEGKAEYKKTDQQLLINLGLSSLLLSGLFISAFGAAGVLSREIEDRTVLTVISKPVRRAVLVLGKYLGVSAALVVAYYLCSLVFLMTVRHGVKPAVSDPLDIPVITLGSTALVATLVAALFCNYFFGWNFVSASVAAAAVLLSAAMGVIAFVGKGWTIVSFGKDISPSLLLGLAMGLLCVLVFAALAIAASTRLGWFLTLMVCLGFFVVGAVSRFLFHRWAAGNLAARAAYMAWPNFSFFFAMDALMQGRRIPPAHVALVAGYAGCQIVAILAVGMALFQRRELERVGGGAPLGVSILAGLVRAAGVAGVFVGLVLVADLAGAVRSILGLAIAAGGVLLWFYGGWLGRGLKWAYYLMAAAALVSLLGSAAAVVLDVVGHRLATPTVTWSALGASAAALIVLLLPVSRHHFGFVPKRTRPRQVLIG